MSFEKEALEGRKSQRICRAFGAHSHDPDTTACGRGYGLPPLRGSMRLNNDAPQFVNNFLPPFENPVTIIPA